MNFAIVRYLIGWLMGIESLFLLLPAFTAVIYREPELPAYIATALICMVGAGILCEYKPKNTKFYAREGFVAVALCWLVLAVTGALPFVLSREIPFAVDAIFEAASGFTTTGATILGDVEALSHASMLWRCLMHWVGGMGVLVFVMAILPMSDGHTMHILRAEMPGPTAGKLVSRMSDTAKILYGMYFVMTLVMIGLLLLGGMDLFDASVHAFGAAGTGGFSSRNASVGAYNSAYIDVVTGIGMLAFGINFNLYYFLLMRRFRDVAKSEELWAYLGIVAFSTVTIAANIRHLYGAVGTSLRHAFFQVSSIITTTGYATVDFDQWPGYAKTVLVLLMFVGGCAGSTGGGLKVTRVVTLVKAAFMDMRKMIHPNAVVNVRMEGRAMPEKQVRGVQAYFSVYMLLYAVSWLLLSLNGFDLLSTFTALSACINNIGPGLGMVGPTGNFSAFAPWAKLLLSFDMLAGRLEIFPMLLLFVPSTWRGNRLRRWERRN